MPTRTCQRCHERPAGIEGRVPFRGELQQQVRERICQSCWDEWLQVQIKLINELALNLGDPRSHEIVEAHARDFFGFSEGETGTDFEKLGEEPPGTDRPN